MGLSKSSPGNSWCFFQGGFKRLYKLALIGTYFPKEGRDNAFLLLQDGPNQVLGFDLLMAVFFGNLLSSLNGLLGLQCEFVKSPI